MLQLLRVLQNNYQKSFLIFLHSAPFGGILFFNLSCLSVTRTLPNLASLVILLP